MKQEINTKIATFCGWVNVRPSGRLDGQLIGRHKDFPESLVLGGQEGGVPIPDYCSDLNSIHEAEFLLPLSLERHTWRANLEFVCGSMYSMLHATAFHRAEAFVKTIESKCSAPTI